MFYNKMSDQLKALQAKANEVAEKVDEAYDTYYRMEQDMSISTEDCESQHAICKALDKEWETLDEAVEVTRDVVDTLTAYYEFCERHEELDLM